MLPVYFGDIHRCSIIVDFDNRNIQFYDSLNGHTHTAVLDHLSRTLIDASLSGYGETQIDSPVQYDGHNFGVCVVMKMWCFLDYKVPTDFHQSSMDCVGLSSCTSSSQVARLTSSIACTCKPPIHMIYKRESKSSVPLFVIMLVLVVLRLRVRSLPCLWSSCLRAGFLQ